MTPRRATSTRPQTPVERDAIARAPRSTSVAREQGCALPPPPAWPTALKRLAVAQLGRLTFEEWARPFCSGSHEPMWCLLRTAARRIRRTFKYLTNEEAWTVCTAAARAAGTTDSGEAA